VVNRAVDIFALVLVIVTCAYLGGHIVYAAVRILP